MDVLLTWRLNFSPPLLLGSGVFVLFFSPLGCSSFSPASRDANRPFQERVARISPLLPLKLVSCTQRPVLFLPPWACLSFFLRRLKRVPSFLHQMTQVRSPVAMSLFPCFSTPFVNSLSRTPFFLEKSPFILLRSLPLSRFFLRFNFP